MCCTAGCHKDPDPGRVPTRGYDFSAGLRNGKQTETVLGQNQNDREIAGSHFKFPAIFELFPNSPLVHFVDWSVKDRKLLQ